jgi:hypothetical protein
MWWCVGYGKTGCSLAAGENAERPSPTGRGGRSAGPFANQGGSGFRSSSRWVSRGMGLLERLGLWVLEARRRGRSPVFANGTASSSHGRARHSRRLSGPVELDVCALDEGSSARVAIPKICSAGFGVNGRTLFAGLGSDPAEAGAVSVRAEFGYGGGMARGGIPCDTITGATV